MCVYVCVCVFSLSYAVCVAHTPYYIVICGLSGSTYLPSFSAISPPKKGAIFAKKKRKKRRKLLNIKCVFLFSLRLSSELLLVLRRIRCRFIVGAVRSSCKVPTILVRFYSNQIPRQIFEGKKNPLIPNLIEIRHVEAGLFHADRRTGRQT